MGCVMTFSAQDQQRLENIRARFHTLHEYLGDLPEKERRALSEALGALNDSLEELEVAEEELRQQNEDLYKAQQQLEAERKRYQDLYEFAPDGYLVTTALGVIVEANRAATHLFEMEDKKLLGRWIWQYFADEAARDEVQR